MRRASGFTCNCRADSEGPDFGREAAPESMSNFNPDNASRAKRKRTSLSSSAAYIEVLVTAPRPNLYGSRTTRTSRTSLITRSSVLAIFPADSSSGTGNCVPSGPVQPMIAKASSRTSLSPAVLVRAGGPGRSVCVPRPKGSSLLRKGHADTSRTAATQTWKPARYPASSLTFDRTRRDLLLLRDPRQQSPAYHECAAFRRVAQPIV